MDSLGTICLDTPDRGIFCKHLSATVPLGHPQRAAEGIVLTNHTIRETTLLRLNGMTDPCDPARDIHRDDPDLCDTSPQKERCDRVPYSRAKNDSTHKIVAIARNSRNWDLMVINKNRSACLHMDGTLISCIPSPVDILCVRSQAEALARKEARVGSDLSCPTPAEPKARSALAEARG